MLKLMRHHARYFYVLFVIVILSFIFWGVGTLDQNDLRLVAEVGKYKITADEYERALDRTLRFYRELYQEKFDEKMQSELKLNEKVLDSLIDSKVLLIFAQQHGISVSDEELNQAINTEPAFLKDGVFDSDIYLNRLRLSRLTPEAYESMKRQELVTEKARRFIELAADVASPELGSVSADEQTLKAIREAMTSEAKEKAVKSYIEAFRKELKIKVNRDLIS